MCSMWSSLARVVGPKCEGCPWHKLMPSTVPAWSIADMKSAAAYTNFKESTAACKLWESVVQYDARVSAPPALASAKQHEHQTSGQTIPIAVSVAISAAAAYALRIYICEHRA